MMTSLLTARLPPNPGTRMSGSWEMPITTSSLGPAAWPGTAGQPRAAMTIVPNVAMQVRLTPVIAHPLPYGLPGHVVLAAPLRPPVASALLPVTPRGLGTGSREPARVLHLVIGIRVRRGPGHRREQPPPVVEFRDDRGDLG